ncbi:mercuric reductase [Devosia pacifica]|uniref:Mercuric reductase n=1 Tax=Devosia pacifica TaxID=1335967 RepID=A0A918SAG2_9HYPH|nr:FAD-containing oxidoreductase [Devosia pacifica]GHA31693.1 mercuric reductase [Devosia pacifica]
MSKTFDAIFIGAGQSGPFLAADFANAGHKVALIERAHLGGTCVNDGCTPTKTMVASARAAHLARRGGDFGVNVPGPISVDMKAVKRRKDEVVNASVTSLSNWLGGPENLTLIEGEAKFTGTKQITVNGETLTAEKIFINTGARARIPDWAGIETIPYLTNTSIMDLDELPEHLVVVGGNYVGLEFAQMFRRFGSEVTVIEHGNRLAKKEDPDISSAIADIVANEDIEVLYDTSDISLQPSGTGFTLTLKVGGAERQLEGSHLLLAIGRVPNTDALDPEAAGIEMDKSGHIPADEHLRTNVPGIFALGDVNGRGAFTHTSYNEYEIVKDNLLSGGNRSLAGRIMTYAMYIDPPLGRAGLNETQAREQGREVLVASMPMSQVSRAKERSETQGLMKVVVDANSKRIIGASILGIEGDEVVQTLLAYMASDVPYTVLTQTMQIHPTVTELLPTLLGKLEPLSS